MTSMRAQQMQKGPVAFNLPLSTCHYCLTSSRLRTGCFETKKGKMRAEGKAVQFVRRMQIGTAKLDGPQAAQGLGATAADVEQHFTEDGSNDYHCGLLYLVRRLFQCDLIPEQYWKGLFDVMKTFVDQASSISRKTDDSQATDDMTSGTGQFKPNAYSHIFVVGCELLCTLHLKPSGDKVRCPSESASIVHLWFVCLCAALTMILCF